MTQMSEAAKKALINVGTNRQGATVDDVALNVWYEMYSAGLIGVGGGLTRKGTIVRERLMSAELEKAFG
jgi:hypothetical protein